MTPEQERLRDAYLAELWPVTREVPADIRAGWAALARANNEALTSEQTNKTKAA